MSEITGKVEEFREIVNTVIANNVAEIESGCSRPISSPGYKKQATLVGLTFASLDNGDVRTNGLTFSKEHMWGVTTQRVRMIGKTAFMAVTSSQDKPDTLLRTWSFMPEMFLPVQSEKELTDLTQIEDAVDWISSPHLAKDEFNRLGQLEDGELEAMQPKFNRIEESRARLSKKLRVLEENQRKAWRDSKDIIIY